MDGYAKENSTTFVSGDSVTRGWQTVLDRYKARYDTRAKMGTLAFTELEFTPDWSIGRGECLVETPKGIVKSFLEEHLERISEALQKVG